MTTSRLVVAGGGLAGLLAAAGCARSFDEVVVVGGRDATGSRPIGSAQAGQLHNVLTRGQRHLEELLPGFRERALAAGMVEGSVADDTHVFEFGGPARERALGMAIWSAPWAVLRDTASSLLPANVVLHAGTTVDQLVVRDRAVHGARVRSASGTAIVDADAVVDATGYGSSAEFLLRDVQAPTPPTTERRLDRWFVTLRLRRPPTWVDEPDFWMVFTDPPDRHVALVSPFRTDEWVLSISSQSAQKPPRDLAAVGDFLDGLPGPPLRPLLDGVTLLAEPSIFRRRTARWHHYEQIVDPLAGFAPVGDAFAAIDPVYGQGVGIAAWQASQLREAIDDDPSPAAWTRRYLLAAGDAVAQAWALEAVPVPAISLPEWIRLAAALEADVDRQRRYVGLWHLVEPLSSLRELVDEVALCGPGGEAS